MKHKFLPSLIIVGLLTAGAAYATPGNLTQVVGSIHNNVYTNKYFKFKMPIPNGWHSYNSKVEQALSDRAQKMYFGKQSKNATALLTKPVTLFLFTKKPLGITANTVISGKAVPYTVLFGSITTKLFLQNVAYIIKNNKRVDAEVNDHLPNVKIGGKSFAHITVKTNYGFMNIEEDIYAVKIKDYIYMVTSATTNSKDQEKANKVLHTIEFSK